MLVVIGSLSATVLHVQYGVIHHVHHFVKESGNRVFDRPVKGPRPDIDFMLVFVSVDGPDGFDAVMTVCLRCALDGNDWGFKLIIEEVLIQHTEQLFKLTGKAGRFHYGFHVGISPHAFLKLTEGAGRWYNQSAPAPVVVVF